MILPSLSFLLFALTLVMEQPTSESQPTETTVMPPTRNPLTSHVLDTAIGRPAAGIKVILSKKENDQWRQISEQMTNEDGRVGNIVSAEEFTPAVYKLYFDTATYYQARNEKTFYPYVEIVFEIEKPEEHYHVPILISAYGYSTYRGS